MYGYSQSMGAKNRLEDIGLQADSISTDMSFLKELAHPLIDTNKSGRLNSVSNLAQLLKKKNSRFAFSHEARLNGQQWVRKKGGDVNPLLARIQQIKKQIKVKEDETITQSECLFYMLQVNNANQQQYLDKNFEFGLLTAVKSIMKQDQASGSLSKRFLHRRSINRLSNQSTPNEGLPTINFQLRNIEKKLSYLQSTKELVNMKQNLNGNEWAVQYSSVTKNRFWQILSNQLSTLTKQNNKQSGNWFSTVAITSLKMVQHEFAAQLPPNYENVLYYLTNNYLGKMRGQYDCEGSLGPIWGVCFLLYRAGRLEDLYRVLPDQKIRNLIQQAQASINSKKPIKQTGVEESGDLFYNQLVYALKGIAKCSTQALSDSNTLDIVWVFLRNIAIFGSPQDILVFNNLRKQLFDSYKGPLIKQNKIRNLLYLLGYSQIVQIGPNQLIDQDDYLHFLITLYNSSVINLISSQKKPILEQKLTQSLVQHIQSLLLDNNPDYIIYMVLLPISKIVEEISSIVSSSNILDSINWKYLQNKLNITVYRDIVTSSLEKYAVFHQSYVKVAGKYAELLDDGENALKLLIRLFHRHVVNSNRKNSDLDGSRSKSISISFISWENQLNSAETLADELLFKDQNLAADYQSIFSFYREYRMLLTVISERNENRIYDFLRNSKYILISEQLSIDVRKCLLKLIDNNAFECYIHFLRNIVRAQEIALLRMNKVQDLIELNTLTYNALLILLKIQPYDRFVGLESVRDLLVLMQNQYIIEK